MSSNTIAKNTIMLYTRQILILLVSLYTVRVVLDVLGVEDYGIYNVVAGVVTFFSFLSGTMASATQRFFSFALGRNDIELLKKTFTVNWFIYVIIAVLALLLLESIGLWFIYEQLKIPSERFESALLLYHFSVLTFIATVITAPFMAIIIAHEDMHIYAYVSIADVMMKLGVVFLLLYLPWDKLEQYGILVFAISIINVIIYVSICSWKYVECQFRKFYWDKKLLREVIDFTGWTLFGQVTSVFRHQAVTILLNQVFNPVVVAARVIAINISSRINLFSNNFNLGLYPPIIKAYAAGDMKEMFLLVFNGAKLTFFLNWVFTLPMFFEMEVILNIWLKNPPEDALLFTRLALIEVFIFSLSSPLATAARAPGRMKMYELILGTIQIAIFVASWIVLKLGGEAYTVFLVAIIANLVMFFVRLLIIKSLIGLSISSFFHKVVLPVFGVVLLSSIPAYFVHSFLPSGLIFSFTSVCLIVIFASISMYYIGLNKELREKVKSTINTQLSKVF